MNKHILKYVAVCLAALSFTACNDSESDLLEPKVYFDSKESKIVVEAQESMEYDTLTSASFLFDRRALRS